jgi:hypothetical protein
VIVEEVLDHGGVQVIVLDPIGHWWSLRAGANGKPGGGYPVAVFGGMHGDLPLEETAGKLLAQTASSRASRWSSTSRGSTRTARCSGSSTSSSRSSTSSSRRRRRRCCSCSRRPTSSRRRTPKGANVPRMVGAANRISKRGRGRGIGMLYVTQRSAALNKNVLDQSDTLIVMRTIGPRDRKAIEGWVQARRRRRLRARAAVAAVARDRRGVDLDARARPARAREDPQGAHVRLVADTEARRGRDRRDVKPIDVDALGERSRRPSSARRRTTRPSCASGSASSSEVGRSSGSSTRSPGTKRSASPARRRSPSGSSPATASTRSSAATTARRSATLRADGLIDYPGAAPSR